jgi:hypothetical protein
VVKFLWGGKVENPQDIPNGFLCKTREDEWAKKNSLGWPIHRPSVSMTVITTLLPPLTLTPPPDTDAEWSSEPQALAGPVEPLSVVVMSKIEGEMAMVLKRINYQNILLTIFFIFIVVISFV